MDEKIAQLRTRFASSLLDPYDDLDSTLESPIERLLFWALMATSVYAQPTNPREVDGRRLTTVRLVGEDASIEADLTPQVPVIVGESRYRLDFGIAAAFTFNAESKGPRAFIALECDGHQFHERTAEQAERDKRRDRELQSIGWNVARFTGSEITRNPIAVAQQVWALALDLLRRRG